MREIKFRYWDAIHQDFILDCDVYLCPDGEILVGDLDNPPVIRVGDSVIASQYIGACDRNDVEIYEDDIFRRDYEIGREIFDPVTLGFEDYEITKSGYYIGKVAYRQSMGFILNSVSHFNSDGEFIEKRNGIRIHPDMGVVIGNIYQNPELLNQT